MEHFGEFPACLLSPEYPCLPALELHNCPRLETSYAHFIANLITVRNQHNQSQSSPPSPPLYRHIPMLPMDNPHHRQQT